MLFCSGRSWIFAKGFYYFASMQIVLEICVANVFEFGSGIVVQAIAMLSAGTPLLDRSFRTFEIRLDDSAATYPRLRVTASFEAQNARCSQSISYTYYVIACESPYL